MIRLREAAKTLKPKSYVELASGFSKEFHSLLHLKVLRFKKSAEVATNIKIHQLGINKPIINQRAFLYHKADFEQPKSVKETLEHITQPFYKLGRVLEEMTILDDSESIKTIKNMKSRLGCYSDQKNKPNIDNTIKPPEHKVQDYDIDNLSQKYNVQKEKMSNEEIFKSENRAGENYGQTLYRKKESNNVKSEEVKEKDSVCDKSSMNAPKGLSITINKKKHNSVFNSERQDRAFKQWNPSYYDDFREIIHREEPIRYLNNSTILEPEKKRNNRFKNLVLHLSGLELKDDKKNNKKPNDKVEEKNKATPKRPDQEQSANPSTKTKQEPAKSKSKKAALFTVCIQLADDKAKDKQTERINNRRKTDKQSDVNVAKKRKNDANSNVERHPRPNATGNTAGFSDQQTKSTDATEHNNQNSNEVFERTKEPVKDAYVAKRGKDENTIEDRAMEVGGLSKKEFQDKENYNTSDYINRADYYKEENNKKSNGIAKDKGVNVQD